MTTSLRQQPTRTLAIDPCAGGLAFAVLDDLTLLDWGNSRPRGANVDKNQRALERVRSLIEWYHPDVVLLEDYTLRETRRSRRVRQLLWQIVRMAERTDVRVALVPLTQVRIDCGGSPDANKRRIALGVAARYPELRPVLPPPRKIWMAEHYRMGVFDAVALAVTYSLTMRRKKAA